MEINVSNWKTMSLEYLKERIWPNYFIYLSILQKNLTNQSFRKMRMPENVPTTITREITRKKQQF